MKNQILVSAKRSLLLASICAFVSFSAYAEVFQMKDGTVVEGTLIHFYEGVGTVVLPDGNTVKIKSANLKRIVFSATDQKAKPKKKKKKKRAKKRDKKQKKAKEKVADKSPAVDSVYQTPRSTFSFWRKSLLAGDLENMASCFVETARPLMLDKLESIPKKQRRSMIKQTKKTKFEIDDPVIDGDNAVMRVTRRYKKQKVAETYRFKLENGEWKIVPN